MYHYVHYHMYFGFNLRVYQFAEIFAEKTNFQMNEKVNGVIYLRTEVVCSSIYMFTYQCSKLLYNHNSYDDL
jgi:hypothetical protein